MKTVRLYQVEKDRVKKVGRFDSRDDALEAIREEYHNPHELSFVYTVVDLEDPVASSMIMKFHIEEV